MNHFLISLVLAILAMAPANTCAQRGDKQGETQDLVVPKELVPPAPPLSPEAALETFKLKPGFVIELVASEPWVEAPVAMAFDPDGGLWVVEMRGFMPSVDGRGEEEIPGRVVYLKDTNGDGQMDEKQIFLDGLIMPRAVSVVQGGVLVAEPPHLWFCRDLDGDRVCDEKVEVASDYGRRGNPEHTANGLLWALDNWIYSANHQVRFRNVDGTWLQEATSGRGQWGITQDDWGRLFFNSNSDQLRADFVPSHYARKSPDGKLPGLNMRVASDQSTYPARVTPGVNRGYQPGTLREDGTLARFTAACGPCIYRGKSFPGEFHGNAFVCEPAGNLIKRNIIREHNGILSANPAYPDSEFLASTDERFRPVNLYSGPDGALYIVDMYRGILQHRIFVTTYLRNQILDRALDQPLHQGRIYRIVYQPNQKPLELGLDRATSGELVEHLAHPNGWWRDTAQRLLIERRALEVAPELKRLATESICASARLHALWTLDGLGQVQPALLEKTLDDPDPKLRSAALRLAEPHLRSESPDWTELSNRVYQRIEDEAFEVQMQLALTLGEMDDPAAQNFLAVLKDKPGLVGELATFSLNDQPEPIEPPVVRKQELTAPEQAQLELGKGIYEVACLACHQPNGQGQEGLAPPLVGSEWVGRSPEYLARIVLHGLRGPITVKGQTYELEMPALGVLNDEQIAAALSYIRREWGHDFPSVRPDTVKEVRAATSDRFDAWTVEELLRIQSNAAASAAGAE